MYLDKYTNSWAVIVGINKYKNAPPLSYAKNDAESIAKILKRNFNFKEENIILLIDESATRDAVRGSFLQFTGDGTNENDRILVFFAGHGHTHTGQRGEVGFLVPIDGKPNELGTLVRWDFFTRNADVIKAKHILFIMDACYGGLAVTRAPGPGSQRFFRDMLQRQARQVITAGKADEVLADAGGPLPDHSVFTGHLLKALEGNAAMKDGIISANSVMSYVYEHVSKDQQSRQTPHFGFIDGDGDFFFNTSILSNLKKEDKIDEDVIITMPPIAADTGNTLGNDLIEEVKTYIPDSRYRIKLDNIVTSELRRVLYETDVDKFPAKANGITADDIGDRLKRYEDITITLRSIIVLIAFWGGDDNQSLIRKAVSRLSENCKREGGSPIWLYLRWYPVHLLLYSGGIAAIAANKYNNLFDLFNTKVKTVDDARDKEVIIKVIDADLELQRLNLWKMLPGYEKYYVPKSEYLFKFNQPQSAPPA